MTKPLLIMCWKNHRIFVFIASLLVDKILLEDASQVTHQQHYISLSLEWVTVQTDGRSVQDCVFSKPRHTIANGLLLNIKEWASMNEGVAHGRGTVFVHVIIKKKKKKKKKNVPPPTQNKYWAFQNLYWYQVKAYTIPCYCCAAVHIGEPCAESIKIVNKHKNVLVWEVWHNLVFKFALF